MSSANFFSMLEDNTSTDVVEIAKKRQQTQQQKPAQPKETTEKKAPQTTGDKKPTTPTQQGEKTQKPQTQENRGRGGRGQRPQTAGDNRGEAREGGRGRGRGERRERREGEQGQRREDRPQRVRKEGEGSVSAVDTTTEGGDRKRTGKSHTYDANAPRRGRQYDRSVSGTGRGRGLKKGGEGAHNWGKEGDQDVRRGTRPFQDRKGRSEGKVVVKGEDAPVEGVTAPIKEGETTEQPETPTQVEGETKVEGEVKEDKKKEEEVDNTLTLEEYQKQQAERRKNLPNLGRPESAPAAVTTTTTDKKKKEKKEKTAAPGETLSIQEFLKDRAEELNKQRENDRERGGRGRGRQSGGRGRGGQKRQDAPNLKDEKAFPSLSGK